MAIGNEIDMLHQNQNQEEDEEDHSIGSLRMMQWRGNWVVEEEAMALRHVFDNLQDCFGHHRPDPRVRFSMSRSSPNDRDLNFTYNIEGQECNIAYIGVDICLDLTQKQVHKYGQPLMKDYGKTWVYAYMPDITMDKIKSFFKAGTGLNASNEGIIHDHNRNLVAIEAKIHHQSGQPKPSFWVSPEEKHTSSTISDNSLSFSRIGSVQEVFDKQPSQGHIHRGVGMFMVSAEIGDTANPGGEASLSFTLVSIRTWGVTDCVAPIVYSSKNEHEMNLK